MYIVFGISLDDDGSNIHFSIWSIVRKKKLCTCHLLVNLTSIEVIFRTVINYGRASDPKVRHHVDHWPHLQIFFFIGFCQTYYPIRMHMIINIISPYTMGTGNLLPANKEKKKRLKVGWWVVLWLTTTIHFQDYQGRW